MKQTDGSPCACKVTFGQDACSWECMYLQIFNICNDTFEGSLKAITIEEQLEATANAYLV